MRVALSVPNSAWYMLALANMSTMLREWVALHLAYTLTCQRALLGLKVITPSFGILIAEVCRSIVIACGRRMKTAPSWNRCDSLGIGYKMWWSLGLWIGNGVATCSLRKYSDGVR